MNAADQDIDLQRTSTDVLAELEIVFPRYLWRSSNTDAHPKKKQGLHSRRVVTLSKTSRLIKLLETFQEWPQLLDPHLRNFLQPLVSAFLDYLVNQRQHYTSGRWTASDDMIPLPRGICKILYNICKVRGAKVVLRFLSNEPQYLDLMLHAFDDWSKFQGLATRDDIFSSVSMTWEEKYVMLLWMSHLLLAPFDLISITSVGIEHNISSGNGLIRIPSNSPVIAKVIVHLCAQYLGSASKEREAAVILLVRLATRPDMQDYGLIDSLMNWALSLLQVTSTKDNRKLESTHMYTGVLSVLHGLVVSADISIILPYLHQLFNEILAIILQGSSVSRHIYSSAVARKLIIKILRSITLRTPDSASSPTESGFSFRDNILEEIVDQLLSFQADKDTPVRCAASKALSLITIKLEPSLASEIVEAVIGCLKENILWEDVATGEIIDQSCLSVTEADSVRRNLTAVDPLRWHGLVLTLSYLIHNRSPPAEQLPDILNALISALEFEQRSSVGMSIGTNVRDAACFGLWALARRYTTKELLAVNLQQIHSANNQTHSKSAVQALGNKMVVAATLDPFGNIRRGASAALQELIGRHPDTIAHGISVVQTVDYQGVSLRSKAILEIAVVASRLDKVYWHTLVDGLLDWRGVRSSDISSRRFAATAIGILATQHQQHDLEAVLTKVVDRLKSVEHRQVEERHGLLLTLAAIIDEVRLKSSRNVSSSSYLFLKIKNLLELFRSICHFSDKDFSVLALRPDLTTEGSCSMVSALASASASDQSLFALDSRSFSTDSMQFCIDILNWSLLRTGEGIIKVSSKAANDLFQILDDERKCSLVRSWIMFLSHTSEDVTNHPGALSSHIAALGAVAHYFSSGSQQGVTQVQQDILKTILKYAEGSAGIESRIAAMKSLSSGVLSCNVMTAQVAQTLRVCLDDYTIDQRGDIGSLLRIEAIDAVGVVLSHNLLSELGPRRSLLARVCRLACEKFDKVRLRAWVCMQDNWNAFQLHERSLMCDLPFLPSLVARTLNDFRSERPTLASVSTLTYCQQLLSLCSLDWLRLSVIEGFIISSGTGSESVLRSFRAALVAYVRTLSMPNLIQFGMDLVAVVNAHISTDRILIPALLVIAFLFDVAVFDQLRDEDFPWHVLVATVQRSHYKSSNMHKLGAAVTIYTGLAPRLIVRNQATERLCSMLLHPYPTVRNAAADGIFMLESLDFMRRINWAQTPKKLKSDVQKVRQRLWVQS